MSLRAVAFDVDGTLYPNASMYFHTVGLALANLKLMRALEKVRIQLRQTPDTSEDFHRVQARLMAETLGITPERAYALVEARIYTRWYKIFSKLRPFPGLVDALNSFQEAGLKLAVLSDFPIRGRLKDLGLPDHWACAFSTEETGYLKPHPQAFQLLAQKLNLPPEEILYVGNSFTYDVLGAQAAGMPCAHLTRSPRTDSPAVLSFQHYDQLKEFVFRRQADLEYNDATGRLPC